MPKLAFYLLLMIVCACNNDSQSVKSNDDSNVIDPKKKDIPGKNDDGGTTDLQNDGPWEWTASEIKKFATDCRTESAENVTPEKMNAFCDCMLKQAQKYYPGYRQMEDEPNEAKDEKIFEECLRNFATRED